MKAPVRSEQPLTGSQLGPQNFSLIIISIKYKKKYLFNKISKIKNSHGMTQFSIYDHNFESEESRSSITEIDAAKNNVKVLNFIIWGPN